MRDSVWGRSQTLIDCGETVTAVMPSTTLTPGGRRNRYATLHGEQRHQSEPVFSKNHEFGRRMPIKGAGTGEGGASWHFGGVRHVVLPLRYIPCYGETAANTFFKHLGPVS